MTIDAARRRLLVWSLTITGAQIIFLTASPAFGFPLAYPKNFGLLEIVSPVFLGYLGSAAHFIFQSPVPEVPVQKELLSVIVTGPLIVYVLAVIASLAAFGYSNRVRAPIGAGLSTDNLATALSAALAILAATTGVISSYLFAASNR
jgi:hypothetical protein